MTIDLKDCGEGFTEKKEFWVGCLKANKVFSQRKQGPEEKNSTRKKTIFIQF